MDLCLKQFLNQFFSLEIAGKKVRIPYWRNKFFLGGLKRIQGPFGGKGTPLQIKKATYQKAKESGVNLESLTSQQIRKFMEQKRIGLDCSGFVFQVLAFLKPNFWQKLAMAPGRSKNPQRRFNAAALTAGKNTLRISKISLMRIGDLIPVGFAQGKIDHVMIVVEKNEKEILYAHSSNKTKPSGPHLGKIKIIDPEKPLEEQKWQETLIDGRNLLELAKEPLKKIGVRRIKQ